MLAISACTEPVPVNTVVNEPPYLNEPEEYKEGSFAKLLSELLQKPEMDFIGEIEAAYSSDDDIETLFCEEQDKVSSLDFIKKSKETVNNSEEDLSDGKIPDEHLSALLNADYLNVRPLESVNVNEDFLSGISNLVIEKHLPELELDADFFMVDPADISQIASGNLQVNAEEDADNKKASSLKARSLSKPENMEALFDNGVQSEKTAGLKKGSENENYSRLDEVRRGSRRGISFEVRDMRTETANTLNNTQTRSYAVVEASAGRQHGEAQVREITLELRLPEQNNQNPAPATWEAKAGNQLENMLARELHQNFNGDIVRHASMALRDGGEGTIKIALKPENLGNVKIHLEMTENKITGRIVVESAEALNAFRKEMSSLEQAFRDSGFANADLNLSLTSDGQSAGNWEKENNSFTPRMAALRYDGGQDVLRTVNVLFEQRLGSINMLA